MSDRLMTQQERDEWLGKTLSLLEREEIEDAIEVLECEGYEGAARFLAEALAKSREHQ